jgi:hypothetical protein
VGQAFGIQQHKRRVRSASTGTMLATMVVPPSLSVVGSRSGDVPERGGTGAAGSPPSGETMSTTNPPDPPNPLSLIFEVTKAEVDLQFKLAERFDAKGRGFFTIAAAFFVAAQTIALRADVLDTTLPRMATWR